MNMVSVSVWQCSDFFGARITLLGSDGNYLAGCGVGTIGIEEARYPAPHAGNKYALEETRNGWKMGNTID